MKHTPGPWHLTDGISPKVLLVNDRFGQAVGEVVYVDVRNPADAELVSAAPQRAAAVVALLKAINPKPHNLTMLGRAITQGYDALEKAGVRE